MIMAIFGLHFTVHMLFSIQQFRLYDPSGVQCSDALTIQCKYSGVTWRDMAGKLTTSLILGVFILLVQLY